MVLYAAILRMGLVVEAIVEETAIVARDIYRTIPTISHRKTEGKAGRLPRERVRSPPSSSVSQTPRRRL